MRPVTVSGSHEDAIDAITFKGTRKDARTTIRSNALHDDAPLTIILQHHAQRRVAHEVAKARRLERREDGLR